MRWSLKVCACVATFAILLVLNADLALFQQHPLLDASSDPGLVASTTAVREVKPLADIRPRNLRLVFLGDSVTRYQYLSLAYFLRYGRWFDPDVRVNNLVHSHSFHHPLHPDEDWNEFFLQSNRMLYPFEVCDCLRSWNGEILVERRYFFDDDRNNMAVYINMNGNQTNPGRGYYGRLDASDIFGPDFASLVGLPLGMGMHDMPDTSDSIKSIAWEYFTWGDVIRYHIGELNLGYNIIGTNNRTEMGEHAHIILNAGLHSHDFRDSGTAGELLNSLQEIDLRSVWKTTTNTKDYMIKYQANLVNEPIRNGTEADFPLPHMFSTDIAMCLALDKCFNVSWTASLNPQLYYDNLHFLEPVYRVFNEDLLEQLGILPTGYTKFDRTGLLDESLAIADRTFKEDVPFF